MGVRSGDILSYSDCNSVTDKEVPKECFKGRVMFGQEEREGIWIRRNKSRVGIKGLASSGTS